MTLTATACRSCGKAVLMVRHTRTGKFGPIDVEPQSNGNILLLPDETYTIVPADPNVARPVSHFYTCSSTAKYRKRGNS